MFSTLWLVGGSLAYLVVAAGVYVTLKPERKYLPAFVITAFLMYLPFVGYPFFTSTGQSEERQRDIATLQIDLLKQRLDMLDKTTGLPKEDRYLDRRETASLIDALAHKLPADAEPPPAGTAQPICDYLYLYGWFQFRPELSLNQKWSAALYMPRLFYKPETAFPANATADYAAMEREVRQGWAALRRAAGPSSGLGFCPDPP